MSYLEETRNLGALECFDAKAFEPDSTWPSNLCNFILALAVASNDLRDIFMAKVLLKEERDENEASEPIDYLAISGGITITLLRFQVAVIHELLNLVETHNNVINSVEFQRIYSQLDKLSKESWDRICAASREKRAIGSIGKALLLCRNKVGFHYDAGQISRGYKNRFSTADAKGPPVLSRGNTMHARRFYFADAAIEQYISELAESPKIKEVFLGGGQLIEDINRALYDVITLFVNARGFGYREYRHKT